MPARTEFEPRKQGCWGKHEEGDQWIECINVEKTEGMKIFIYQNFNI